MKKIAVVTGATRGIGRAIAVRLAKAGFEVHGIYNEAEDLAKELHEGYGIIFHQADLADRKQVLDVADELARLPINALVNNAGVFEPDNLGDMDYAVWDKTLAVNTIAPLILSCELGKSMQAGASIVNISSTDGMLGAFDGVSYAASKAALMNLTKSLANHLGSRGIRVNAVAPGWIDTEMVADAPTSLSQELTPLGRNGSPDEVANIVEFLISDKASFVNGETITVDGGLINVDYVLKKEAE